MTERRSSPQGKDRSGESIVRAAFGAGNRERLINAFFAERGAAGGHNAWEDVYRLLLWIDQTTGLAHCYESDKCQPGKHWYGRTLAFHDWVASSMGVSAGQLGAEIDWLFRRATADLAAEVVRKTAAQMAAAERQRKPYEGRGFPKPGEDQGLVQIVREVLGTHLSSEPEEGQWELLVQRIRQYLARENKRRNLLGEGFEDVIASVIRRAPAASGLQVHARRLLHELPGFHRRGEKPNKVDLAVIRPNGTRTLVTVKWSVRADREKQFPSEFAEYVSSNSDRKPFEYVFVTNEFDPARLMRACESYAANAPMFAHVVHISTDALRATYGKAPEESMQRVLAHIDAGRLIDLSAWIERLVNT